MEVISSSSSTYDNGLIQHLTVVLNQYNITDYETCANEIIQHYINNDFPNTQFSYDTQNYPSALYATVYLKESDISNGNFLFQFSYKQNSENNFKYNMIDHPEMFHISIKE